MSKIMLVEDDTSLLEIYQARLEAEGFNIVTARDGEEALTVALKEHPDLIIADVMMPKVSGFDMVDILRSTPETKGTKIIMMTALNQAEDKARAKRLGADKYLVKSQVTLEDVTRVVHEVLTEQESAENEAISSATGAQPEQNKPSPTAPTAKPQAALKPVSVASGPVSDAPQPTSPAPTATMPPTKPVAAQPPASTPIVAPVAVATVPVDDDLSNSKISMPPSPDMSPPQLSKGPNIPSSVDNVSTPKVTPITITDDASDKDDKKDEEEKDASEDKVETKSKDPFLAQNPTLSDSANPSLDEKPADTETEKQSENKKPDKAEPEPKQEPDKVEPPSINEKAPNENKVAEDAVKSLLVDDKKTDELEPDDKNKYVSSNNDNSDSKSLNHSKTIEPTPGISTDTSTQLPDLSEIDTIEAPKAPPAVNTVITPDPGSTQSSSEQS